MKFYGDIKTLSGYELPVVDCITGGSPCQDLSVAGRRAGLDGERSGLFIEQIRIVKEMRERDRRAGRSDWMVRPRYMVWENVPGAFSSNGGKDFRAVLTEIVRIADQEAPDVPMPDKGRWDKSGCLYSDMGDWSVAWRVHDAQYWGVPQRRKRIALVADFGGMSAPEVLFERKGLSRDSEPRGTAREETAGSVGDGAASTSGVVSKGNGECFLTKEKHMSLSVGGGQAGQGYPCVLYTLNDQSVFCLQGNGIDRADTAGCNGRGWCEDVSYTLNTIDRPAANTAGFKGGQSTGGIGYEEEKSPTLSANPSALEPTVFDARGNGDGLIAPTITGDHENRVTDYTAVCVGNGQLDQITMKPICNTLDTMHDQQAVMVKEPILLESNQNHATVQTDGISTALPASAGMGGGYVPAIVHTLKAKGNCQYREDSETYCVTDVDCRNGVENPDINGTLQAKSTGGIGVNFQNVCRVSNVVRRLTPLECERLQGYPDGWTDIGEWIDSKGKRHKEADSPRYKALGNSIALPFWFYLLRRISAQYERPATLGSLFDGIGGFPLCWERCNGRGTALWSSEIEEFSIAVVKHHFGGEG